MKTTTTMATTLTPDKIDRLATRYLARHAMHAEAIDPSDFDFIDENPERAHEVSEFVTWLCGEPATA